MKKSFFIFFLSIFLLFPAFSAFAEEPVSTTPEENTATDQPTLSAEAAILIDAKTGEILFEKNSRQKMYPASITKLMTMLLAFEKGNLADTLTFSHDAIYSIEPGSAHIALQEGEQITLEQAIYGIILRSANEASNGIAEYVDSSVDSFAQHMTARAKELGCENTNFVNANGLFDENHYTTAYDMALIAKQLLTLEDYRNMMSVTDYELPPTNMQAETRFLHGQHQMLNKNSTYYYEYATGGKTGYTSEALNTLVTYAKKGETELIAVVLKCNGAEHYVDTKALFEYGFANYKTVKVLSAADYTKTVSVTETYKKKITPLGQVTVAPAGDIYQTLPIDADISALTVSADIPETVSAPVAAGQTVGTVTLTLNGQALSTIDLKAAQAVAGATEEERAAQAKAQRNALLKKIAIILGCVILGLCILLGITRTIGRYQRQKRRKRRQQHRKGNARPKR